MELYNRNTQLQEQLLANEASAAKALALLQERLDAQVWATRYSERESEFHLLLGSVRRTIHVIRGGGYMSYKEETCHAHLLLGSVLAAFSHASSSSYDT